MLIQIDLSLDTSFLSYPSLTGYSVKSIKSAKSRVLGIYKNCHPTVWDSAEGSGEVHLADIPSPHTLLDILLEQSPITLENLRCFFIERIFWVGFHK